MRTKQEKWNDIQESLEDARHGITRLSNSLLGENIADARHDFRAFLSILYSGFQHCYAALDTEEYLAENNGQHSQFNPEKEPTTKNEQHAKLWKYLQKEQKVSVSFNTNDLQEWLQQNQVSVPGDVVKKLYTSLGSCDSTFFQRNEKGEYTIDLYPDTKKEDFKISLKTFRKEHLKGGAHVGVQPAIKDGILSYKKTILKDVLKDMRNPDQHASPIKASFEKDFAFILGDIQIKHQALFSLRGNYTFKNCTFCLDQINSFQGKGCIFKANIHIKNSGCFGDFNKNTLLFENSHADVKMIDTNVLVEEGGAVHFENHTFGANAASVLAVIFNSVPTDHKFQNCYYISNGKTYKISEKSWQKTTMPKGISVGVGVEHADDAYQKCCTSYTLFKKATQKTE